MKRFKMVAACALPLLAIMACTQKSEGPAEQAGKKVDEAVQETTSAVGEAAEKAGEHVEAAGEKLQEGAK